VSAAGLFCARIGNPKATPYTSELSGAKALNHDAAPLQVRKVTKLRSSAIPFADLPGQSSLFLDYLRDPQALRRFYPNAVAKAEDLSMYVPLVLDAFDTNRQELCDAVVETNRNIGNGTEAFGNIDRLRRSDCVAVVTGQQTGLFTGPLYTIYKALTAVATSNRLCSEGVNAVPVFWAATEDHDFEEVSAANVIDSEGRISRVEYSQQDEALSGSVGDIRLDGRITEVVYSLFKNLSSTEFTQSLRTSVEEAWHPEAKFGYAFERQLAHIFAKHGLIVIDPLHPILKKLAAPLYSLSAHNADLMVQAIRQRGFELERAGYHQQVLVEEHYFPLFWNDEKGNRLAIRSTDDGGYTVKGGTPSFSKEQLVRHTLEEPNRFSPGVILRPIIQDHLLPSVCYIGGGAEIAYFAQNSEAYRILGRPVTPVMPRQSFTIVGSRHQRTLERFHLEFADLFEGVDSNLQKIGRQAMPADMGKRFDDALATVEGSFAKLREALLNVDKTLIDALEKRRKKIVYHIDSLRHKAELAATRHDTTVERQVRDAVTSLVPNGHLQERVLNVTGFLNKYGPYLVDWLYEETDVDARDHILIYI
jgi:bacillithiol biosynthesis cysteine-adding enzyme BshC